MDKPDDTLAQASTTEAAPATSPGGFTSAFMPRGGTNTIVVTDSEKEAFFKAFMSDSPYEHKYPLFGGRLSVTLRAMTSAENGEFYQKLVKDRKSGVEIGTEDYATKVSCYRLTYMLQAFDEIVDWHKNAAVSDTQADVREKRMTTMGQWSMPRLAAVLSCLEEFDYRLVKLTQATQDPDFWKAVA